jgi:hypothetical protein
MKKIVFLVALVLAFAAPAFAGNRKVVPHFAVGGGYKTTIIITNIDRTGLDYSADLTIWLHIENGVLNTQGNSTIAINGVFVNHTSFSSQPGKTLKFVLTSNSATTLTGAICIDEYGHGDQWTEVAISCFYDYVYKGKLINTTAVPVFKQDDFSLSFKFSVEKTSRVNTGMAWVVEFISEDPYSKGTPYGDRFRLQLYLYDRDGYLVGSRDLQTRYSAKFLNEIFQLIPDDFLGYVHIYSFGYPTVAKIGLTVLRMETNTDGSFLFTSIPVSK